MKKKSRDIQKSGQFCISWVRTGFCQWVAYLELRSSMKFLVLAVSVWCWWSWGSTIDICIGKKQCSTYEKQIQVKFKKICLLYLSNDWQWQYHLKSVCGNINISVYKTCAKDCQSRLNTEFILRLKSLVFYIKAIGRIRGEFI